jgi:hypothetical protein
MGRVKLLQRFMQAQVEHKMPNIDTWGWSWQ